ERAIAPQSYPQVLGGSAIGLLKLIFEAGALAGESLRQALHDLGHELVRLPHSLPRIVDKPDLHLIPAGAKAARHIGVEQRSKMLGAARLRPCIIGLPLLLALLLGLRNAAGLALLLVGLRRGAREIRRREGLFLFRLYRVHECTSISLAVAARSSRLTSRSSSNSAR